MIADPVHVYETVNDGETTESSVVVYGEATSTGSSNDLIQYAGSLAWVSALGILLCFASLLIPLLGFGFEGIAAGSVAAGIQSAFYGGETTGIFSMLQSAGATGAWMPTAAVGGAAVAGADIVRRQQMNKKM